MRRMFYFVVILLFAVTPSLISARESVPKLSPREIKEQTLKDYGTTEEVMNEYQKSLMEGIVQFQEGMQVKIRERAAQPGFTPEKAMDIAVESMADMGNVMQETSKRYFNEEQRQKMQLRMFQSMRSIEDNALKSDDTADVTIIQGTSSLGILMGPPDFLDLSDTQKSEMIGIQKEAFKGIQQATQKQLMANATSPENLKKLQEIQELAGKMGKVETDEERKELTEKLVNLQSELLKDAAPEIKRLLQEGRKKSDALLTDAQRAKIESVMDQIPEYLWQSLPLNQGKDRAWRPGLDSWVPGMGAPEGTEDIREAKPKPTEKGRRFPGSEEGKD